MAKPFTLESLRNVLVAHGVEVGPQTDIAATASKFIADRLAAAARDADRLVPDRKEAAERRAWLAHAAKVVRRNPFKDAPP